tara:strand:+ start:243 stop:572 length:330 start_codon:yes stop_codon:yes gene_type:complete
MAVPKKNFNQIEDRVKSLNDLTYYKVHYEYELSLLESLTDEQIDVVHKEVNGVKEFVAINDDVANSKIEEWLESLVLQEIITEYEVTKIEPISFYDKLMDKKLGDFLEL